MYSLQKKKKIFFSTLELSPFNPKGLLGQCPFPEANAHPWNTQTLLLPNGLLPGFLLALP